MWVCDTKQCVTRRTGGGRAALDHQDQTVARDGQSGNRRTLLDRQTARSRDLAERASSCGLGRQCLAPRRDEHNQRPFAADFSEPQDVNAAIIGFGFNVAIVGSVPLIDHFDDANPALAPIKTSRLSTWASTRTRISRSISESNRARRVVQPLTIAIGRSRATLTAIPVSAITSTTWSTAL